MLFRSHGKHSSYRASFANDGAWHHVCVAWRRRGGVRAIYVDGERGDGESGKDTPRDIHGDGILILGQDQDSFGGNLTEPFVGNITDVNVWSAMLEGATFRALSNCASKKQDVLFSWSVERVDRHAVVREVSATLFCPGKSSPVHIISGMLIHLPSSGHLLPLQLL